MPVEETQTADLVVEALRAIDTATLQRVADETGIAERTLWRWRRDGNVPPAKRRPLERALGLSSFPRARDATA
jgi:hypothetical protein